MFIYVDSNNDTIISIVYKGLTIKKYTINKVGDSFVLYTEYGFIDNVNKNDVSLLTDKWVHPEKRYIDYVEYSSNQMRSVPFNYDLYEIVNISRNGNRLCLRIDMEKDKLYDEI